MEYVKDNRWYNFRFWLFILLAYDTYCSQERAISYDHPFKVSHISYIPDEWLPSGIFILVSSHLQPMLSIFCAFGIYYKLMSKILCLTYTLVYMSSRLDSFQHHYFVILILMQLAFVINKDGNPKGNRFFIKWNMSILYLFTSATKFHHSFINGDIMKRQLIGNTSYELCSTISFYSGISENMLWIILSLSIIITEIFLSVMWYLEEDNLIFWMTGVIFHLMIEMSGFYILRFSYYMITMYSLVMPHYLSKWTFILGAIE